MAGGDLQKMSGVDKTCVDAARGRMLLETDAPYLSPVPHRGKRQRACLHRAGLPSKLSAALWENPR